MKRLALAAAFVAGAIVVIGVIGTKWGARQLERLEEVLFV